MIQQTPFNTSAIQARSSRSDLIEIRGEAHHIDLTHTFSGRSSAVVLAHVPSYNRYAVWEQDLDAQVASGYQLYNAAVAAMQDYSSRIGEVSAAGLSDIQVCEPREHLWPAGVRHCLICGQARLEGVK